MLDLAALPKVQLHCHLEGTVRPETFRALAARHEHDLGERADPERTYAFSSFLEFLYLFRDVLRVLRTPADFARIATEYVEDAAAQGVRYAELHVSPSAWTRLHPDLDVAAAVAAIRAGLDHAAGRDRPEVALIADLTRNFGAAAAEASARQAVALREYGVVAVGLGGDEANWPPEPFAPAFAIARAGGLHVVAHAGEAAGAGSVRGAVEVLGAERIGHGVRAIEDGTVVRLLAEQRVPVEICPTSNRRTGAALELDALALLDASGCVVTIDADDPALFGASLLDEYALVAAALGDEAVLRFARNGIDASFAPEPVKRKLRRTL